MKHKPIKKEKQKHLIIGAKTYLILREEEENKYRVRLIKIESNFNTNIGIARPFTIDVKRLDYNIICID